MAEQAPIIQARGLTKVFKDFWLRSRVTALDDLDLDVTPHQVFGLLGPNGSGKSTAIKIILGLLHATRGRVAVFGKHPSDVSIKNQIGYLPEESYLYRFLNARETLEYYGRLFKLPRADRRKRIDMLLEMVGLDAVQRRPVGEFSKGMQRRIGLAQALINDPQLLILDEPTTGMDPIGTRQIKDLILHLKDRGKTVMLSSHLLADVEDVCDRSVILYGGRKRAEGTIDELLTVDGTSIIETDALNEQTIAKIERVIEQEEGKSIRSVRAPRQKLEQLFLDIVHRAQTEGAATSGARSGGRVAEFLIRDSHLPEQAAGAAVIDELLGSGDPEEPVGPADTDTDTDGSAPDRRGGSDDQAAPADEADAAVIESLTGGGGAGDSADDGAPERSTDQPPRDADDPRPPRRDAAAEDRDVLDELLGGDKR